MKNATESRTRSAAKAVGYRLILIVSNGILIFFLTKKIDLAVSISLLTAILNTAIYYFYERVWLGIRWGRAK